MDYNKYKEAKEYVKYWETEKDKIHSERIKLKNPFLTTENYLSVMNYRLYKLKKEYSDIIFLYNHDNKTFSVYKDYTEQLIHSIFKITKVIRDYKIKYLTPNN